MAKGGNANELRLSDLDLSAFMFYSAGIEPSSIPLCFMNILPIFI